MTLLTSMELPFASGIATQEYKLAELAHEDAEKNGFTHFYMDCSLDGNSPETWKKQRIEKMKEKLLKSKIKPIAHGKDIIPLGTKVPHIRQASVEYIKEEINIASEFNTSLIIHGGQIHTTRSVSSARSKSLSLLIESLYQLSDFASNKNVTLLLENLPFFEKCHPFYNLFSTEQEFANVLSAIPSLRMVLDIGHLNVSHGDYISVIKRHGDRIDIISFSDNNGLYDTHAQLGLGNINWVGVLRALHSINWKGTIVFETRHSEACNGIKYLKDIYSQLFVCSNLNRLKMAV